MGEVKRNNMIGKRGLIKFFCALMISFLLVCSVKLYQIQYQSIWAESVLNPIWNYDTVRLAEGMWSSQESLSRDEKIKLYFVLGSAKKYRGSEKKYKLNELNERSLIQPCIVFITDKWDGIDDIAIAWEYKKNTIFVEHDEETATRYFLDEKNAKVLYDLFMKYNCIGPGAV